jgi:hypothetical protein
MVGTPQAASTSCTAHRADPVSRGTSSGPRTPPVCQTRRKRETTSALPWPTATSTATGSATWPPGSRFGSSLAIGDLDGDGIADLVAGVPGETVNHLVNAGATNVTYGSTGGLTAVGAQLWTQASWGVLEDPEAGDYWAGTAAGEIE